MGRGENLTTQILREYREDAGSQSFEDEPSVPPKFEGAETGGRVARWKNAKDETNECDKPTK